MSGHDLMSTVYLWQGGAYVAGISAHHDDARFAPGAPEFLTQDEESSGIIPAPFLGEGKYLADVKAHYASPDPELVQGGQLLVLQSRPGTSRSKERIHVTVW